MMFLLLCSLVCGRKGPIGSSSVAIRGRGVLVTGKSSVFVGGMVVVRGCKRPFIG